MIFTKGLTQPEVIKNGRYLKSRYSSAMAEVVNLRSLCGVHKSGGESHAPCGHFAQVGKHVIITDHEGFVHHHKFLDETWATNFYEAMLAWYIAWDEEGTWESEQSYAVYIYLTNFNERQSPRGFVSEDLYTYEEWLAAGHPLSHRRF